MNSCGLQWNAARKRYAVRLNGFMAAYVFLIAFISDWLGFDVPMTPPLGYVFAALPGLAVGGAIWSMGRYLIEEPDEFQRMLIMQALLWAMGVGMAIITAWGFVAQYVGVWALPLYLVFPLFCALFGITAPLVRLKYR